ncbi:MAG: OmpA family protein [Acidobacteriota bacterium]
MRRYPAFALAMVLLASGCRKETVSNTTALSATASPATATSGTTSELVPAAASESEPSLVSYSAGALLVQKPPEYGSTWQALWILDERSDTGYATPENTVTPQTFVVEMPERSILEKVIFDNAGTEQEGRSAREVSVEVSDTSPLSGFQKIADVTLAEAADNQAFPVASRVPGRWVRLTLKNNYGSSQFTELMDFRATGRQLTHTPFQNVSGTYATDYGNFHVRQEGNSVSGCYEYSQGLLSGGVDGRIMKFTWSEGKDKGGPAIMVFTSDGQQMVGLWWFAGQTNVTPGAWNGKKTSTEVGGCPQWSGSAQTQLASELKQAGHATIYGINFDTDSDQIRPESKSTLDQIVAVLKENPEWQMTIAGHTDSTSTPEHNKDLSERRAIAVKSYLQNAGVDGDHLSTIGYGAEKPLATNDTSIGRAQNRRVELIREPG